MRRVRTAAAAIVALVAAGCLPPPPPTGLPQGFRAEVVAAGLDDPTSFAFASADRVYVAEKAGVVRVVRGGRLQPTPVVDLQSKVNTLGDRGINGMALDPDFAHNGYLYLTYTYEDPTLQHDAWNQTERVTRLTVVDDVADPASEVVVLGTATGAACYEHPTTPSCLPTWAISHSLDDLQFAADGSLLVSVGDGGLWFGGSTYSQRAQDLDILRGKVLRIDPATGRGVPGNPFFSAEAPGANRSLVYAYGFRNPYRMTLRPGTNGIYVGDVGEVTWEEVNVVTPGANYGWPCFEGNERLSTEANHDYCEGMWAKVDKGLVTVTAPVATYHHTAAGGAIISGAFVTGTRYPAAYRGDYFYGDYSFPFIRRQRFDAHDAAAGDPVEFADSHGAGTPVAFKMGPDGNLWYLSLLPGELRRIVYDGTSSVPASCPDGSYRVEYFNNLAFSGTPANVRCEDKILKRLHDGSPAAGVAVNGWTMRATGRLFLDGGTYRFATEASDGARVRVDGQLVVNRWSDRTKPQIDQGFLKLATGIHTVQMEYYDRTGESTAVLAIARRGTPPVVTLTKPADLVHVAANVAVPFTVTARDAEDGTLPSSSVSVDATMLHYTGTAQTHVHPYGTRTGTSGTFTFTDAHGPSSVMFELRARAMDASGITTVSPPIRVCLAGGHVGPCS
ncbi:MAG: hypothetical protein JWM05_647 [Acidimicrobiales bacterium]|nr:hypothetical protein [Acidimicrobiales bacterium]